LINKLGIRDFSTLLRAERNYTSLRLYELSMEPIKGVFDLKHLQDIHHYIFQDIYEWAGNIRTVDIAKGNVFCHYNHIQAFGNDIFSTLKKDGYLFGLSKHATISKLAYYFGEINALHPFREGNGRSQREFIYSLAHMNGYELNFDLIDSKRMIDASKHSFNCNYNPMIELLQEIITPLSQAEHQEYLNHFLQSNSILRNIYNYRMEQMEMEQ